MRHLRQTIKDGQRRTWTKRAIDPVFTRRIRRAMRRHDLTLHYQPKLDLSTGEITSVEALARWRHGGSVVQAAAEFVPRVEASSALGRFNDYVLTEAIRQAAIWRGTGMSLQVAVNVPIPCLQPGLVMTLRRLLHESMLPADLLQIEITEGGMPSGQGFDGVVATLGDAAKTLDRIRDMGVTIALDDFGTAHSTLARLVSLPVDAVKIDRSFVTPMLADEMRRDVVLTTIQLAHRAGLWVVAEGVETADHVHCLSQLGADSAQGYWLARPMPAAQMAGWLQRQRPSPPTSLLRPERTPKPRPARQRWGALHRAPT